MFVKSGSTTYVMDREEADKIYTESLEYLNSVGSSSGMNRDIFENTIISIIVYRVGSLAVKKLKDRLDAVGFVTVNFTSEVSCYVTVGIVNDEFVYGRLEA